jgi:hypothetical protein
VAEGSAGNGGISFFGMLAILFIGLKLTGFIDWSWWVVLSPLWLPLAISVGLVLVIYLFK